MTFVCVFLNWRLCCDFWVCVFELAFVFELAWMLWLLCLCFLIGVCVLHLWATVGCDTRIVARPRGMKERSPRKYFDKLSKMRFPITLAEQGLCGP